MVWFKRFVDPIVLPDGRKLLTLRDAAEYITALPSAEHDAADWQIAMETLLLVAERDGPEILARIAVMKALNRKGVTATEHCDGNRPRFFGSFGDASSPVNNRDNGPNPRIATLHCAIVKAVEFARIEAQVLEIGIDTGKAERMRHE